MGSVEQSGSLEVLIESFKTKLCRVEQGFQILDVLHFSMDGPYHLRDVANDITDLSAMNEAIRMKLQAEKDKIEAMKAQKHRLVEVRRRINHICYHLPDDLPQLSPYFSSNHSDKYNEQEKHDIPVFENKENQQPTKSAKDKKVKCLKLLLDGDFAKIPKHVKSHLNLAQINSGISEVNHILDKKYEFLKRPKRTLSRAEDKKRAIYLEMGKDLKGTEYEVFFMDSDIQRFGSILKTRPKTRETVFLVLRHIGKMKEMRKGKPPRYCILGG